MIRLKKSGTFALLCVACLTIMVGCVIVPGLPSISKELGVPNAASWLVTLPSLGVVVFGPAVGKMMSKIGAYKTLCIGLVLYGALGLIGRWIYIPSILFADRLVLGGATAMVMASGTALLSEFYEGQARLKIIALQGMAIEMGGVIFLAIGGILATISWNYPFFLYLSAWVFLAMILAFVPNPSTTDIHPVGADETKKGASETSGHGTVYDVFIAACFSLILFFTAVIFMPTRLAHMGLSEDEAGYFMSFISLMAVCAAYFMPKLERFFGGTTTLGVAFACYAVSLALYTTGQLPIMIIGAIFMGAGFGFSVPLVNHLIAERSSSAKRGQNLAYLSMAIFLGQFLSSFMGFVSNNPTTVFGAAAIIALILTVLYGAGGVARKIRHGQTS